MSTSSSRKRPDVPTGNHLGAPKSQSSSGSSSGYCSNCKSDFHPDFWYAATGLVEYPYPAVLAP